MNKRVEIPEGAEAYVVPQGCDLGKVLKLSEAGFVFSGSGGIHCISGKINMPGDDLHGKQIAMFNPVAVVWNSAP